MHYTHIYTREDMFEHFCRMTVGIAFRGTFPRWEHFPRARISSISLEDDSGLSFNVTLEDDGSVKTIHTFKF